MIEFNLNSSRHVSALLFGGVLKEEVSVRNGLFREVRERKVRAGSIETRQRGRFYQHRTVKTENFHSRSVLVGQRLVNATNRI